jgi:hypothetical protein
MAGRSARRLGEASECGTALGIPKVALLFLTPGPIPLEQVRATLAADLHSFRISHASLTLSNAKSTAADADSAEGMIL